MAGRSVSEIAPQKREAGTWSIRWDGRGSNGQAMATGVYFVQMKVDGTRIGMSRLALVR
jgi:flagellar hook assembly protein FlgD